MKNYELLYILPSSMTSKEIKENFLEIKENIIKLKGEMLETLLNHPFLLKSEISKDENAEELKGLPVTKRRLAYPIKKNKFGFYCLVNFKSDPENINEINNYLRINRNIARHLIIQEDPMSKKELEKLQGLFARKRAEQEKEKREVREVEEKEKREKTKKIEKENALQKKKIMEEKKEEKKEAAEKEKTKKEVGKEKVEQIKEKLVEKKIKDKTTEEKEEKTKKEETAGKKKKIRLEDLEDKLDEILEDTMI